MRSRTLLAFLLAVVPSFGQGTPSGRIGWYNGDRAALIGGVGNYYVSDASYARIYDDFVVPAGGWTVNAVFSHHSGDATGVKEALWEIRSGVSAGDGGTVVASGRSPATQTLNLPNNAGVSLSRTLVEGLQVPLPPGRYWLNVAPVISSGMTSYLAPTKGGGAFGEPKGDNGGALITSTSPRRSFVPSEATGQGGTSSDYSQGIVISMVAGPAVTRTDLWRADIAYLMQEMPARHGAPFQFVSKQDFEAAGTDLMARAAELTEAHLRTGIQAMVASVGDSHSDVGWGSPSPIRSLPLNFYKFSDGLYVTGASEAYAGLLGGRVTGMGGLTTDEMWTRLTKLVPHENENWVNDQVPRKMQMADFLFGSGIADRLDVVRVEVENAAGERVAVDVPSAAAGQLPRILPVYDGDLPYYRQHTDRNHWAQVIDGGATVYFQYNSCYEDPKQPWAEFVKELNAMLEREGVKRLVVDLRANGGGNVSVADAWITQIRNGSFNRTGRLYVIIGRHTFSAAIVHCNRFREQTAATFVGEPTGGKPRFQTRAGDFTLPFFDIRVSYSRGVMNAVDTSDAVKPDVPVDFTFADYLRGGDPYLEAILAIPAPE